MSDFEAMKVMTEEHDKLSRAFRLLAKSYSHVIGEEKQQVIDDFLEMADRMVSDDEEDGVYIGSKEPK
jgi:hypothetical protein